MIAATVLLLIIVPVIYWDEVLVLDPGAATIPPDFIQRVLRYQQYIFSYLSITWTAIFAVKFAFLFFFRQMVDRVRPLEILWRVVLGVTAVSWAICVSAVFISCPHFGLAARSSSCLTIFTPEADSLIVSCPKNSGYVKSLATAATSISLDISTDLLSRLPHVKVSYYILIILVIAIPVSLLWRVKIRPGQKIVLAALLCLSICMIICAVTRVSGVRTHGNNIDVEWETFWQYVESCIAIMMVSFTAFRSLFKQQAIKARERRMRPLDSIRKKLWYRGKSGSDRRALRTSNLPTVPSPTLTGMRTFIHGNHASGTASPEEDNEQLRDWPQDAHTEPIRVRNDVRSELHDVRTGISFLISFDWSCRC